MAKLTQPRGQVPSDLLIFEFARWIQDAIDNSDPHLENLAVHLNHKDLFQHWYAIIFVAPARYRQALKSALGSYDGERQYAAAMNTPAVKKIQLASIRREQSASRSSP
jgi:hypothetical protein